MQVQAKAVYGSPELHRDEIRSAELVANPGCYATSVILALKPLVAAGWIDLDRGIVSDAKSGVSGAGKAPTPKTHYMYAADNLSAYGVFAHRHTGELLEQLGIDGSQIIFTPHLLPIPRGILATTYVSFKEKKTADEVEALYRKFYADSPMVRLFGAGHLPQIQYSVRTNYCDIGFATRQRWPPMRDRLLPRQPAEGRSRAGRRKSEPDVRMGRSGGTGMRFVVKLGGATLENPEILHQCAQGHC